VRTIVAHYNAYRKNERIKGALLRPTTLEPVEW
jgi:hypothetical protein